jgi:hypothetical protein
MLGGQVLEHGNFPEACLEHIAPDQLVRNPGLLENSLVC